MVDLQNGFEGFEKLGPHRRKEKAEEDLMLAREAEKAREAEIKSDGEKAGIFYESTLSFVTGILDEVKDGREAGIKTEDILRWAEDATEWFLNAAKPDDIVSLVFQHDEYKTDYLYTHSVNVCFLSACMALGLDFPKDRLRNLSIAALFHDIGMMRIPMDIWNKNRKLNRSEYEEVQKHVIYGEKIFRNISGIDPVVAKVISQHQEKADGTGYPNHLTKEATDYLARLVSLINRYEAQTHSRLWRPRFLPDATIQQLVDNEYNSYDQYFMKALLHHITMFPVGAWVKINSGDIGKIVRTNPEKPMRPVVDIVYNRKGKRLPEPRLMDMSKQLLVHVEQCIDPEGLQGDPDV